MEELSYSLVSSLDRSGFLLSRNRNSHGTWGLYINKYFGFSKIGRSFLLKATPGGDWLVAEDGP